VLNCQRKGGRAFEPGGRLTNEKYESFSINFDGIPGIYV